MHVLVIVPYKPDMKPSIEEPSQACLSALKSDRKPPIAFDVLEQRRPFPSEPTDCTPWSKVTRVRNYTLDTCDWEHYTHILWIDGDIVDYPPNLLDLLMEANPNGVCAPMVLIEGGNSFYDRSAFIIRGRSHFKPHHRIPFLSGRNLNFVPPYWAPSAAIPKENFVDMDCVGSVTLVNTDIYRAGARYEDHPSFTDHFPICCKAWELGGGVTCRRDVTAYHANLPKHGEQWH